MVGEFLGNRQRAVGLGAEGGPERLDVSRGQDADDQRERSKTMLLEPPHDEAWICPGLKLDNNLKMLPGHAPRESHVSFLHRFHTQVKQSGRRCAQLTRTLHDLDGLPGLDK